MKNFLNAMKEYFTKVVFPVFTNIQWLEIPVSTYVRWILAIVVSINTIFTAIGWNPIAISENTTYLAVSVLLNVGVLIMNTYKNNSTSKEALLSDQIMRALKVATTSKEETIMGKLNDILEELNGEDYIDSEHTNLHESSDNT